MPNAQKPQGRLMVLMFTDIVNSVALQERLGTDLYSRLRATHNQLFYDSLSFVEGAEVLQNLGDGFLAQFPRTSDAVNAALLFQYLLHREPWQPEAIQVRIGLHMGQVINLGKGADGVPELVGMPVNVAARIASLAGAGQVLLSRAAYDDARHLVREHPASLVLKDGEKAPELFWASRGFCVLKGLREAAEVFEVGAVGIAPRSPQARSLDGPSSGFGAAALAGEDRWLGRAAEESPRAPRPAAGSAAGPAGATGATGPSTTAPSVTPAPEGKVVLVYKRNVQPDESVLALLEARLRELGHDVFIDRHLTIGVEWAREIEQQIREAAAVVPLLSEASITSEMLTYEVQMAHAAASRGAGRPRLLPVRVAWEQPLSPDLESILSPLQYFPWNSPGDDEALVQHVHAALSAPRRPPPIRNPEVAGGAVRPDSPFYVVRRTDRDFRDALERRDAIVLIKGARQTGKTSLLARGLRHAREAGCTAAFSDLQKLGAAHLESQKTFYTALGELLADQLDLPVLPSDRWDERRAPNINFDRYLRREVLNKATQPLVWALDEVDRLFSCSFGGEVFALFRTWHNERALDPSGPWGKLTLVITYATEAHLFITDVNQSPFNVGTRIALEDFTLEQVADLNARYGSPLAGGPEVARLHKLTGGQPFLVRRGLDELTGRGITIEELEQRADDEDGPYGDHLRRLLVMLAKDPELCEAMRGMVQGKACATPDAFYRLRSAGVINGHTAKDAEPRCGIYSTYLQRHLL